MRKNECLVAITDELDDAQVAYVVKTAASTSRVFRQRARTQMRCLVGPSDGKRVRKMQTRRVLRGMA